MVVLQREKNNKKVLENTYQVHPNFNERFPVSRVETIVKDVLNDILEDQSYQAELTHQWTKLVSDTVKTRVKELSLPRYKIMVQTIIGEKRGQGVRVGSRSLWDFSADSMATQSFSNESLFAVVIVYGVWFA